MTRSNGNTDRPSYGGVGGASHLAATDLVISSASVEASEYALSRTVGAVLLFVI